MQKTIKQILEGNFSYDNGSLDFSCTKIEIVLSDENLYESYFSIRAPKGINVEGSITTSDRRMECLTTHFQGENAEVFYRFHGKNLEEGEVIKGEFHIISDMGEYSLPFVVSRIRKGLNSSMGIIRNLFHFTNLAQHDWKEAMQVFYSPKFPCILHGNDSQYLPLYTGLSVHKGNPQNMEEFLRVINKKRPMSFWVENKEIHLASHEEIKDGYIEILFDGWGHISLSIACQGNFLSVDKDTIEGEEFTENRVRLPYHIDREKLRVGDNQGRIIISNLQSTIEITLRIERSKELFWVQRVDLTKQQTLLRLMQLYMDVKQKKIANQFWKKESLEVVENCLKHGEGSMMLKLFRAQLFLTMNQVNEARWILEEAEEYLDKCTHIDVETGLFEAYYLYLTTLVEEDPEYIVRVEERVKALYMGLGEPWKIGWLWMYVSKEYEKSASLRYNFIEKQIEKGCTSPVMYMEMLALLKNNPSALRRLSKAKLRMLYYGAREGELTTELVERILYLMPQYREHNGTLLLLLLECYNQSPSKELLKEICGILIKENRDDNKYLTWYEQGIKEGVRITNLYEYYLAALDENKQNDIPREVLLYFSYQKDMDYRKAAYLYSYVVAHKSTMPDIFEAYHKKIQLFVLDQIHNVRIDRNLAYLYREYLCEAVIEQQNAEELSCLIFSNLVSVDHPGMVRVLVCHSHFDKELVVPLQNGSAWIPIFGNEYCLFLEDKDGNRYVHSVEYRLEKLLLPGKYVNYVAEYVKNQPLFDIYVMENIAKSGDEGEKKRRNYRRYRRIYDNCDISLDYRNEACMRILRYLYEEDQIRELDEFFGEIRVDLMNNAQRIELIRYLVIREKYDKAYEILCDYNLDMPSNSILVRLIDRKIQDGEYVFDPVLLDYCKKIFAQGKYDGVILRYLCMHYQGKVKDMRCIWKASRDYEENCMELSERILVQMLLTGAYVGEKNEIFEYYLSKGGKPEVEKAYLSQNAYDYFVKEKVVSPVIFREIGRLFRNGENLHRLCKLGYIKFYAENPEELDEQTKELAYIFVREMMRLHIVMNCFKPFLQEKGNLLINEKTILEYYGNPESRVYLHYLLHKDEDSEGQYRIVEMHPVYAGVFFMDFVLFFGETIQYYIIEKNGDREELTQSGTLQRTDIGPGEAEDGFARVNDLVISSTLEDYAGLEILLEEHMRLKHITGEVFRLK